MHKQPSQVTEMPEMNALRKAGGKSEAQTKPMQLIWQPVHIQISSARSKQEKAKEQNIEENKNPSEGRKDVKITSTFSPKKARTVT